METTPETPAANQLRTDQQKDGIEYVNEHFNAGTTTATVVARDRLRQRVAGTDRPRMLNPEEQTDQGGSLVEPLKRVRQVEAVAETLQIRVQGKLVQIESRVDLTRQPREKVTPAVRRRYMDPMWLKQFLRGNESVEIFPVIPGDGGSGGGAGGDPDVLFENFETWDISTRNVLYFSETPYGLMASFNILPFGDAYFTSFADVELGELTEAGDAGAEGFLSEPGLLVIGKYAFTSYAEDTGGDVLDPEALQPLFSYNGFQATPAITLIEA